MARCANAGTGGWGTRAPLATSAAFAPHATIRSPATIAATWPTPASKPIWSIAPPSAPAAAPSEAYETSRPPLYAACDHALARGRAVATPPGAA